MAKKIPPQFAKKTAPAAKGSKVAKGKLSPEMASKTKHSPDACLGKHDNSYHNV